MLRRLRIVSLPLEEVRTAIGGRLPPLRAQDHLALICNGISLYNTGKPNLEERQAAAAGPYAHKERAAPCGTALLFRPFPVGNENRSYMPEFGP